MKFSFDNSRLSNNFLNKCLTDVQSSTIWYTCTVKRLWANTPIKQISS